MESNDLIFNLPIGLRIGDEIYKEVELMRTNGVAEKIIGKRNGERPFTWHANVICAAVKRIGPFEIGQAARQEFLKNGVITVPEAVLGLTMADVGTLVLEIHRRVWKNSLMKAQPIICRLCAASLTADIDLKDFKLEEKDVEFLATNPDLSKILVYLETGFELADTFLAADEKYKKWGGLRFNKFTYTPALLKHAIKYEAYATKDLLEFWRRLAGATLIQVESVENPDTAEEYTIEELPESAIKILGQKLYDEILDTTDLGKVREEITEYLPSMPYVAYGPCGCSKKEEIPYAMNLGNFFAV